MTAMVYLLCLLTVLGCMVLLDRRFRLVLWRATRRGGIVLAAGVACRTGRSSEDSTCHHCSHCCTPGASAGTASPTGVHVAEAVVGRRMSMPTTPASMRIKSRSPSNAQPSEPP